MCIESGDYRQWAMEHGYPYVKVLDWTSSAGDWSFIVSQNNKTWFVMNQTNNWPRQGYTRNIDTQHAFYGTAEEVLQLLSDCMEQEIDFIQLPESLEV